MLNYSLGIDEDTRLSSHPNADTAQAKFLSGLTGVGTEDFESFTASDGSPLSLTFPGAGSATLTSDGASVISVPTGTNGYGRYPISGNQCWETGSSMTVDFDNPVAAFGFYGVDIGDFGGQVTTTTVGGVSHLYNVGNTINGNGGGVLYWGVIDTADLFTSVQFGTTAGGVDYFAFDDMTIGSVEQVKPVPEPCSALLLGLALPAIGYWRKRRRSA